MIDTCLPLLLLRSPSAEALSMAGPHNPQCLRRGDYEQYGDTITQTSPILPEYPPHGVYEHLTLPCSPTLPTNYQAVKRGPAAAWHIDDPNLFRVQERKYLSRPTTWSRIQIDIDLPDSPQAIGGRCSPPRVFTPHRNFQSQQLQPSPPSPQQSPPSTTPHDFPHPNADRHRMTQTLSQFHPLNSDRIRRFLITPLPGIAGPTDERHPIRKYRKVGHHSQHPYPPPGPSPRSPGTVNGNARWPRSEKRGAERMLRREGD